MIIAVDFDGTIVDHRYPQIGDPVPGAFDWLKKFKDAGAQLILWTMRSDGQKDGPVLSQAVEFCRLYGVEFASINCNPKQATWTTSPKAYANIYIDDAAVGCPLRENKRVGDRAMVDWDAVGPMVLQKILEYPR